MILLVTGLALLILGRVCYSYSASYLEHIGYTSHVSNHNHDLAERQNCVWRGCQGC